MNESGMHVTYVPPGKDKPRVYQSGRAWILKYLGSTFVYRSWAGAMYGAALCANHRAGRWAA